ncbi:hypothetical protein ES703_101815 [subsurface metagenome]
MKIPAAHILKQFVNRTREVAGFENLLSDKTKRIMCISGPGGIGKSVLLSRMMEKCAERKLDWVQIEWEDSRHFNYLDVMREIRKATDPTLFQLFNDRVNFYTVPNYEMKITLDAGPIQNVEVLKGGQIKQSGVTVHIGHTVEIKDSMINVQRPDRDVTKNEIVIGMTNAFMPCFKALTSERPLVIFLDALEKADKLTNAWIWDELLTRVRDEELRNLLVILSGRNTFEPDPTFFDSSEVYALKPFKSEHILDYLEKRGLDRMDFLADWILANSDKGNPLKVAQDVDNYIRFQREKAE